jgi:hypothetical protein
MISASMNLNKKIKEIEVGKKDEKIIVVNLVGYLLGSGILAIDVYATLSLQNSNGFQEIGYSTMHNCSVFILKCKFRKTSEYVTQ